MRKLYENRWRYIRNIDSGGQASVVLVKDESGVIPGELALKRLTNADNEQRRARFDRETKALESIDHPNILRIHHKELRPPSGDRPFFVAEYCPAGSLKGRGDEFFKDRVGEGAAVLVPIVQALEAAHRQGIFHRDCKPANILFRADWTPVLGDFGICHMEDGELVTLSLEGMGSKNFIAPEMESGGTGEISGVTDAYSLAKVLYWMVSGGRTFARENHRADANYLARSFERQRFEHVHMFLDKFLQSKPDDRRGLGDFQDGLKKMALLVAGDFAPLRHDREITCRFCGLGAYQRSTNNPGISVPEAGLQVAAGRYVVAMWCDYCGHIESFNLNTADHREWWNGKKEL